MQVAILADSCTGCLRCAMACSIYTSGQEAFNPYLSKIQISPGINGDTFDIVFTPECNGCGICVKYCEFGALNKEGSGDE